MYENVVPSTNLIFVCCLVNCPETASLENVQIMSESTVQCRNFGVKYHEVSLYSSAATASSASAATTGAVTTGRP